MFLSIENISFAILPVITTKLIFVTMKGAQFKISGHTFKPWICSSEEASAEGKLLRGIKDREVKSSISSQKP
jgi:hypothetical protein